MKQCQWSFYLIQHSISCFESRIYSKSLLPSPDLLTVTFIKLMHTQSYPVESSWKSQQIGRVDMKSLGGLSVCQDMFLQRFKVGGLPAVSHGCSVLDSLALALPSFLWRSRNEIPSMQITWLVWDEAPTVLIKGDAPSPPLSENR